MDDGRDVDEMCESSDGFHDEELIGSSSPLMPQKMKPSPYTSIDVMMPSGDEVKNEVHI